MSSELIDINSQIVDFVVSRGEVFVLGDQPKGVPTISRFSSDSLAQELRVELPIVPEGMVASPSGDALYIIGHTDRGTKILALDPDLTITGQIELKTRLANPSLTWSGENKFLVTNFDGRSRNDDARLVSKSTATGQLTVEPSVRVSYAARGAVGGWYDSNSGVAVLSMIEAPSLVALDVKSGLKRAEISFPTKAATSYEPFSASALLPEQRCDGGTEPLFLISDHNRDRLSVAQYVNYFQTLNLVTEVEVKLRLKPGTVALALPDLAGVLKPSGLISATCDLGVIWLSSLYSTEVVQYSLNPKSQSLEKVGSIVLTDTPIGLHLSDDGTAGFVAFANGTIRRFVRSEDATSSLGGDPNVRVIQRLLSEKGYEIGAIDGIAGVRTLQALTQFGAARGLSLDLKALGADSIEILKSAK